MVDIYIKINLKFFSYNFILAGVPITEDFCITLALAEIMAMTFIYLYFQKHVARIWLIVLDFTTFGKPSGLKPSLHKLDRYAKYTFVYTVISIFMHVFAKMALISTCKAQNIEQNFGFIIPISTPIRIDLEETPFLYIITLIIERFLAQIYSSVGTHISYQIYDKK